MATIAAGLGDPVHDAQRGFRSLLEALSRPGRARELGCLPGADGLSPALRTALLTLTDADSPVWWQPGSQGAAWLAFHNGTPAAASPAQASFAVLPRADRLPPLAGFAGGSDEAPETSSTLLIELPALAGGPALHWSGPGIDGRMPVAPAGLPEGFWAQWQDNHAAFPRGVDILFCCGRLVMGLPRTVRVETATAVP